MPDSDETTQDKVSLPITTLHTFFSSSNINPSLCTSATDSFLSMHLFKFLSDFLFFCFFSCISSSFCRSRNESLFCLSWTLALPISSLTLGSALWRSCLSSLLQHLVNLLESLPALLLHHLLLPDFKDWPEENLSEPIDFMAITFGLDTCLKASDNHLKSWYYFKENEQDRSPTGKLILSFDCISQIRGEPLKVLAISVDFGQHNGSGQYCSVHPW